MKVLVAIAVISLLFLVRTLLKETHHDHSSHAEHPDEDVLDNGITSDEIAPQKDL